MILATTLLSLSFGSLSLGTVSLRTASLGTASLGTASLETMSLETMPIETMPIGFGPARRDALCQEPEAKADAQKEKAKWKVEDEHGPTSQVEFEIDEGTWMNLDLSPDGKTIVFDLLGDIYAVGIDGGDARPLVTGPAFSVQPRFNHSGTEIAFTSDAGGGDNLWVMKADGSGAHQVTKESFRLVNNPAWTADDQFLIGRKHFTATRSLGAGELWLYSTSGGTGVRLTDKRNDQQDTGEPEMSPDGRYLYFSEDVSPGGSFDYNRDPNGLIYAIHRLDLESRERTTILNQHGGSVRPEISPDGKHLAFVRRIRSKSALYILTLATGQQRKVFDGLSKDGQETWSIFGVYPNFAWTPDANHILIWAKGKITRVDVANGAAASVPIKVKAKHSIRDALRYAQDIGGPDQSVRVIRWPQVTADGKRVIFQALGHIYSRTLPDGQAKRLTDSKDFEYYPTLSPDGQTLAYTTWNDQKGGRVMVLSLATGERRAVVKLPGHYAEPSFHPNSKRLIYRRLGYGSTRGTDFTINPGLYVLDIESGRSRFVTRSGRMPRFHPEGDRILVLGREGENTALLSLSMLGNDKQVIATSRRAADIRLSPDQKTIAWEELFHVYLSPMPRVGRKIHLSPERKDLPVVKLTADGGEFIRYSADGSQLFHNLASTLQQNDVQAAFAHKGEDLAPHASFDLTFTAPTDAPPTNLLLEHVRLITMEGNEIIENGSIHIVGNRIKAIGAAGSLEVAEDTHRINLSGKTIVPGFIDTHAHMPSGSDGMMPQNNWAYLANLAFGITTTHDPSHDTKMVFGMAELERTGNVLAPRIFSTGTILYGAEANFKAVINNLDDARSALRRLKAFGAFSAKSYNQPRREQRQQVITAAAELKMMVVPEGGSMFFHNLSMILDGHTTLEHALPVAPLYDDVLSLFAASKTAYDPTLVVGYGGIWGENYWYEHTNVWENKRLLSFVPRGIVDSRSRRRNKFPEDELHHIDLARSAAELFRRGVPVSVSAHGQMQGICSHWDMWMFQQGGLSAHDSLRTATINGARALGLDQHVGSLRAGKLADLIVLEANPLTDLRSSERIAYVMKNGRLYESMTMREVHPQPGKAPLLPSLGRISELGGDCSCCVVR